VIVGAINIGAHVDRISTEEMIARFLPLLRAGADEVRNKLL
jgi:IclR family transcriptional regulator, pca regulon regulatory protein